MRRLGYVPALDGIRGVAIILVLLTHLGMPSVTGGGAAGVTIFFALSGFLITWLLYEEHDRVGSVSLRGFYRRRALRLLPALLAMLTVVSLIAVWDHGLVRAGEVVATLFYGENWWRIAGHPDSPLSHTWSLSVEEQFYLVWPIVLLALWRHRRVLWACLIVGICAGTLERFDTGLSGMHLSVGTDTRGNALLIGCAAALYLSRRSSVNVPRELVAAAYAIIALSIADANSLLTLVAVATVAVIVWIVGGERDARLLSSWPLRQTGRISYGLYVWHYPIIWLAASHLAGLPPLARGSVLAAASFAVAIASYRWIERPFLRLKTRGCLDDLDQRAVERLVVAR